MYENEIDKAYIDETLIKDLNSIDDERFTTLISLIIESYNEEIANDRLVYITNIISTIFGHEINASNIYRKIKYLINIGIFNRFTKKYKNDLLNLNLDENRADEIITIAKENPSIGEIYKLNKTNNNILKDVQITTNMPVYTSNYNINATEDGSDLKKQKIMFKFDYTSDSSTLVEMNKSQFFSFYQEIEKIQEKLDKLY
jgi:hypothetical protein